MSSPAAPPAPPPARRSGVLGTPVVASLAAITVATGLYLLVPQLGSAYDDVGTGPRLRLSSESVVVGPGDTGTVDAEGEVGAAGEARCVLVGFDGGGTVAVRLGAELGTRPGAAPDAVRVRIERAAAPADGAGRTGCAGFIPAVMVYEGTLRGLTALDEQAPWTPSAPSGQRYRLTFSSDHGSEQPSTVATRLWWHAVAPSR